MAGRASAVERRPRRRRARREARWGGRLDRLSRGNDVRVCRDAVRSLLDRHAFAKAKQKKPDFGQALFAGILSAAAASKKGEPAPATRELCRDGEPTAMSDVFRASSATNGYLLASSDAGRKVSVVKTFVSPDLPNGYAVALHDVDGSTAHFPCLDRLPPPEQVSDIMVKGSPISTMTAADKQVTLTIDGGIGR